MITLDSTNTFDYKVFGNPNIHDQSIKPILTGRADFAADHFPGQKYFGYIVGSRIAHGTVNSVDISAASKVEGVKAVITSTECPLWSKEIVYYGQPIAGVIAEDWYTAIRAGALITATYTEKAAAVDADYAMQPGAPVSGIFPDTNVTLAGSVYRKVDQLDKAFAECDVVKEYEQPWTTAYPHNVLEAHQTTAWWVGDDVYFYVGSQDITSTKSTVANVLGLPLHKVHGITHFNSGGFGDKTGDNNAPQAAIMSRAVGGFPVLCKHTRQMVVQAKGHQFPTKSKIKFGVKKEGNNYKFHACQATYYSDGGSTSWAPCGTVGWGLQTTFTIPYCSIESYRVSTNGPERGYWRDVNDPPGDFNTNVAIDKLCADLGVDPYEFRMLNARTEDQPDQDNGLYWGSLPIKDMYKVLYDKSGYARKHKLLPKQQKVKDIYPNQFKEYADWWYGIAIAGCLDSHGAFITGSARGGIIKAQTDGTFLVITASARGSSGGTTVCCNVVAETLGAKPEDVKLGEWGNTDVGLNAGIQAGSSHTISISSAFYNTALELRDKIFELALTRAPFKDIPGLTKKDLFAEDSVVYTKDKKASATFRQLNFGDNLAATGKGYDANPGGTTDTIGRRTGGAWKAKGNYIKVGDPVITYGSAAAATEVAVDEETGKVEILHIWNCVDTGTTIFKNGALKEIGCGAEAFHNQAFFYNTVIDPNTGAVISTNYTEAMFPTYMDMKTENHILHDYESHDAGGPFGCHGIAEPAVQNYSSIECAIYNAVGVWVDPQMGQMQNDRVLKALGKA
jgi:CO/xanthine dehydrogenase Mo-binding subunit